jgi:hypothetical protein
VSFFVSSFMVVGFDRQYLLFFCIYIRPVSVPSLREILDTEPGPSGLNTAKITKVIVPIIYL